MTQQRTKYNERNQGGRGWGEIFTTHTDNCYGYLNIYRHIVFLIFKHLWQFIIFFNYPVSGVHTLSTMWSVSSYPLFLHLIPVFPSIVFLLTLWDVMCLFLPGSWCICVEDRDQDQQKSRKLSRNSGSMLTKYACRLRTDLSSPRLGNIASYNQQPTKYTAWTNCILWKRYQPSCPQI